MLDSAPYAIYCTSEDGTVTEIGKVRYHGQANPDGGNYQILGLCGEGKFTVGDVVTIAAGTRFWLGTEYYTVTEEITYYYNGKIWLRNFDESSIRALTIDKFNFISFNHTTDGAVEFHLQLSGALEGMPTADAAWTEWTLGAGSITVKGFSAKSVHYYRWNSSSIFLVVKGFIGQDKFIDTAVFEGGTMLWYNDVCYQIPEEGFAFRYTGYSRYYTAPNFTEKYEWMLDSGVNIDVSNADVSGVENYQDGWSQDYEVRFILNEDDRQILNTAYNGVAAINTDKPAIFNGTEMLNAQYYGSSDIIAVLGANGTKDGDYVIIPAGSEWWTRNGGTVRITDEIIATYVNGTWMKGDYRATANVTANNATVTGTENMAKGQTYTITVNPTGNYIVSSVVINGTTYNASPNNQYTFTAQAENTIIVNTVVGYKVYFTVPEGANVNGGAISDGGFSVVEHGGSLTFSVAASEGYKITNVTGTTNNGNGTYTISNVTADKTVTVSVEKLYKVTYSGENASVTANVANDAWVDNGTTVTFTIGVNSGYTLVGVSNATKVNATTYTATVNGADVNVTATALKNSAFVDITDRIQIEDRAWGAHDNEVYVGVLDTGVTYTDANGNENHYFNTSVNDTWYVGNEAPIKANGGVDIMEYIYVNGVSARSLITTNANGVGNSNACACWLSNPAAYPVYVETTNGSGLMIRLATAAFGTEFTITIKAGFRITNADGNLVAVTKDIDFEYKYNNATITKEVITSQYAVNFGTVTGASISVTANGNTLSSGDKVEEGTEVSVNVTPAVSHNLTSVKIDGVEKGTGGTYTFTALKNTTIEVATAIKTYTVTANCSGGVSADETSKTVQHGKSVTFTLTVPANATIKANGTEIYTNSTANNATYTHTVSNVTAATTVTFTTWYKVTWSNPTGATISVKANGSTISSGATVVEVGTSISVTATATSGYRLNTVTIGGASQSGVNTAHKGSSTFNYTVNAATSISATTVAMYAVSWEIPKSGGVFGMGGTELATITVKAGNTTITSGNYVDTGTQLNITVASKNNSTINSVSVKVGNTTTNLATTGGTATVTGTTTITVEATDSSGGSNPCIIEGTMILMADGTQKAVEDLQVGDMLLVFNHYTGQYDARPLGINAHAEEEARLHKVLNVNFSNGTQWRIAGIHGIFDMTLNEYVMISAENIDAFVGHKFYYTDGVKSEAVELTSYYETEEFVKIYSPATVEFANYFASGLLNAPPFPDTYTAGQMNYFDFDENMMYVNVEEDIATYGLYTYEDFAEYISEDVFNAFPFQYFKISVGKGIMTWEDIMAVIDMLWA